MNTRLQWVCSAIAVCLFVTLKFAFVAADVDELRFLLTPTDYLVKTVTGASSLFVENEGYFYESIDIVINKSCSGFNFWMICYLLMTYLLVLHAKNNFQILAAVPFALATAFVLTIVVNASRILTLLYAGHFFVGLPQELSGLIHQTIGIVTYLIFLIIWYFFIIRLLSKFSPHEKFA